MPTPLEFVKAKVGAYKKALDGKSAKEREGRISIPIAKEVNAFIEEIKNGTPEAAPHLPQPIRWDNLHLLRQGLADVNYLELEMILNQMLDVLEVLKSND
jgi:hypothetical protein